MKSFVRTKSLASIICVITLMITAGLFLPGCSSNTASSTSTDTDKTVNDGASYGPYSSNNPSAYEKSAASEFTGAWMVGPYLDSSGNTQYPNASSDMMLIVAYPDGTWLLYGGGSDEAHDSTWKVVELQSNELYGFRADYAYDITPNNTATDDYVIITDGTLIMPDGSGGAFFFTKVDLDQVLDQLQGQ